MRLSITTTLITLITSIFALALQHQDPKKPPSFCGWTKQFLNSSTPDCVHDMTAPCLLDSSTCLPMSKGSMWISVLKDCQCDFYYDIDCIGVTQMSYKDHDYRDAMMTGPMKFYKCKRNDTSEKSGGQRLEGDTFSAMVGATLAVAMAGFIL